MHSHLQRAFSITDSSHCCCAQKRQKPIAIVPTTYNHVHISEFEELGVDIIIYANHLLRSAYPSMLKTAESILKYGRTNEIENDLMSIKEIINFIPSSLDD